MNKQTIVSVIGFVLIIMLVSGFAYGQTVIGGDLKLWLGDITSGSSWVTDTLGQTTEHDTTDRFTMGFSHITFFFTSQISDYVSIEVQPEVSASSRATPRLGYLIGKQRRDPDLGIGLSVAHITVVTPGQFEITAGYLRPIFTEDYGHERFYQENFYSYKAVCNGYLGNIHDFGIEIYKSFDIELGENNYASIPVWLYVLNGAEPIIDNNTNKMLLLHVAPEYGNFILYGSGLYGKWDDADENTVIRSSCGIQYTHKYFWFRGEYIAGTWENRIQDSLNAEPKGYYVKAAVNIVPEKLSLMGCYDYADHNFTGSSSTIGETYATISGVLNYQVAPGSHIMLQIDKANWKNEDETSKLDFIRGAIGWRTVF